MCYADATTLLLVGSMSISILAREEDMENRNSPAKRIRLTLSKQTDLLGFNLLSLPETTRTHGPLYSSSIRPSQQDSLLYTQFSRIHPSSISSSIYSIHRGTHLSLYLNISMCDLVLKDLLRRI
jgi:hypothetical protein